MKKTNIFIVPFLGIFFYIILLNTHLKAQEINQKQEVHLYLLMGQSNMAGRGVISKEYENIDPKNIIMLNKELEWIQAKHPIHFDKPKVIGVGPGLAFAIKMASENPKVKIALIPCAIGGTSIDMWKAGAFDKATNSHPYDDAILRIRAAASYGIFKGVIWHQGEADSSPDKALSYVSKLKKLIKNIRKETRNRKLPWVIGELGRYKETYQNINKVLVSVPNNIHFTEIAFSDGLTHKGDSTHFDSKSADILGKKMAEKMISLQKKTNLSKNK